MAKIDRQYLRNLVNKLEGISAEDKSQLLQLINEEKRYGLVWEDKPEEAEQIMKEKLPIIEEVEQKRIINDTDQKKYPNHIIIEGDNLHALTTLCYTHEGKVDVIYIDPPYNTGNKDFKYNDSFVDKEDAYKHSKWLSFMHRRLKLAKRLLSDRGVIFISIDDNEQAQLKLLCDSVLGGGNFLGNICIDKCNSQNDAINIQSNVEYVLAYCSHRLYSIENGTNKEISLLKESVIVKKEVKRENNTFYYIDREIHKTGANSLLINRKNLGYVIYYNDNSKDIIAKMDYSPESVEEDSTRNIYSFDIELLQKGYRIILPPLQNGKLGCWTWELKKVNTEKDKLVVVNGIVRKKKYVDENKVILDGKKYIYEDVKLTKNIKSLWAFSSANGTTQITNIFGTKFFSNPKNIDMILKIIESYQKTTALILDFFAGSGTTLHATMQLNNEDGGNRQCILVTNNENNICEEVTYERNKRVIQGYTNQKGEKIEGLKKNNLRYYKIKAVGREKTLKNKKTLVALSCGMLNIKENIYKEETTFGALVLKKNKCRYFSEGEKRMLVIIDEEWIAKIVEQLKTIEVKEPIKVYVFSNSAYAWEDDFSEVRDKVLPCALPEAIYNAYKNILPEREDKIIDFGDEKTLPSEQEEELLKMYEQAIREEE